MNLEDQLIDAAANGVLNLVKYLINRGANIHANNNEALKQAIHSGYLNVVELLVEKGIDIHAEDEYALRLAHYYYSIRIIKYLIEKGSFPTENMRLPEEIQEKAILNNPSSVIFITNLRKDLKEKYSDLLDLHDIGL